MLRNRNDVIRETRRRALVVQRLAANGNSYHARKDLREAETMSEPQSIRELAEDILRHIAFDLGETYTPSGAGEELIDEITTRIAAYIQQERM